MELFKGQSFLEFTERFKTDLDCEEYLVSLKWEDGIFTASKTHNSKEYTITQIRRNRRKKMKKQKTKKMKLLRPFHHQVQFFRLLSDRINL